MRLLILLGLLLFASPAHAACVWVWDCSLGSCIQKPVCESTVDVVPVQPPELAPIVIEPIPPIQQPVVPVPGTSVCRQEYLCAADGTCAWVNVCY
jgi:hypothetical protein